VWAACIQRQDGGRALPLLPLSAAATAAIAVAAAAGSPRL